MTTEDGELVASFSPGAPKYMVVLAFDDVLDALEAQERIMAKYCGWEEDGTRFDKVQTLLLAHGQPARREFFGGEVLIQGAVTTQTSVAETERDRKAWAQTRMQQSGLALGSRRLADAWSPGPELLDLFDRWADEAVEVDPAGVERGNRRKTGTVRNGFNSFLADHGRPDLMLGGTAGGRVFSSMVRKRFADDSAVVTAGGSNTYFVGLRRKPGSKPSWFPG